MAVKKTTSTKTSTVKKDKEVTKTPIKDKEIVTKVVKEDEKPLPPVIETVEADDSTPEPPQLAYSDPNFDWSNNGSWKNDPDAVKYWLLFKT